MKNNKLLTNHQILSYILGDRGMAIEMVAKQLRCEVEDIWMADRETIKRLCYNAMRVRRWKDDKEALYFMAPDTVTALEDAYYALRSYESGNDDGGHLAKCVANKLLFILKDRFKFEEDM